MTSSIFFFVAGILGFWEVHYFLFFRLLNFLSFSEVLKFVFSVIGILSFSEVHTF